MRRFLPIKLVLASLLMAACVTVNVYFPAAAAEQAADQIIDKVTGKSAPAAPRDGDESRPQSRRDLPGETPVEETAFPAVSPVLLAAGLVLERLVPAAHAQANADLDISTPEIRAVTASMQQRFAQLRPYFASGAIGMTANGLIEIRDPGAIPLAERAVVKRLVAEDNKDRATLYAEIARANGHPEWEPDIRRIFARRWVERGAQAGWYYQDASGNWVQK